MLFAILIEATWVQYVLYFAVEGTERAVDLELLGVGQEHFTDRCRHGLKGEKDSVLQCIKGTTWDTLNEGSYTQKSINQCWCKFMGF